MAKLLNKGGQIVVTASTAIAAGAIVLVGNIVAYAASAIAAAATGSVDLFGKIKVTKAAGAAWTQGEAVYYDSTAEAFTAVPTPIFAGVAAADALLAATEGYVLLNEGNPTAFDAANVIADPGDGEAIPVTASGRVGITSAAAETRTLAAPSFAGQRLDIEFDVDGGDVTLTCATGLSANGDTTVVFNTAGDLLSLIAVEIGATVRWRVLSASGPSVGPSTLLAIADPGDAGAIPVARSGRVPLVSAGAETRTLAAPSFAGQKLNLEFDTDAGDITLTCATGVNQTGNDTLTFADAGDVIALEAIKVGENLRWRVAFNDGVAPTTAGG